MRNVILNYAFDLPLFAPSVTFCFIVIAYPVEMFFLLYFFLSNGCNALHFFVKCPQLLDNVLGKKKCLFAGGSVYSR